MKQTGIICTAFEIKKQNWKLAYDQEHRAQHWGFRPHVEVSREGNAEVVRIREDFLGEARPLLSDHSNFRFPVRGQNLEELEIRVSEMKLNIYRGKCECLSSIYESRGEIRGNRKIWNGSVLTSMMTSFHPCWSHLHIIYFPNDSSVFIIDYQHFTW